MTILFVIAHPDDEVFGPAGTIAKLATTNDVYIVCLCKGNRPGAEQVEFDRQRAFQESCKLLGATPLQYYNSDTKLTLEDATNIITAAIGQYAPEVVYTHNISDLHQDHRITAEACLIACRPKPTSSVRALFMFEVAAASDWAFGQIEPQFVPNVYIDIEKTLAKKRKALKLYPTELYEYPDARSIKSVDIMAENRGRQCGKTYAEAFKLVFFIE
jgi:LmbE family N-acetylglucosaminyl deacetylase